MLAEKKAPILGIDLGTTTSLACIVQDGNYCIIQPDPKLPSDLLPSMFCLTEQGPLVGEEARQMLRDHRYWDDVVRCVKRYMKYGDHKRFRSAGREYTPAQVSGMILKYLREAAERQLELRPGTITEAVVTVPAYFGHAERRATVEAGEQHAGFGRVHLLDEPIAAALGLGLDKLPGEQLVMVIDLGGGTLDVTLLHAGRTVADGGFVELGRDGHAELGGVNWDEETARIVIFQHDAQFDPEVFDLNNILLYEPCEIAKIDLCSTNLATERAHVLYEDRKLREIFNSWVTRQQFNESTDYLAEACGLVCDRLLESVSPEELKTLRRKRRGWMRILGHRRLERVTWQDIDMVYMVGGGSKVPAVQETIRQRWGRDPLIADKPQHQVAYGAARCAGSGGVVRPTLRSPHTTGYWYYPEANASPHFHPIVRRNARIPRTEELLCRVGGRGSKFRVEIVEERIDIELRSRRSETKLVVVEKLEITDLPPRLDNKEELVKFVLDYSSDRDISFTAWVRGKKKQVIVHGGNHAVTIAPPM
jgi:molecular chaperone DnaK